VVSRKWEGAEVRGESQVARGEKNVGGLRLEAFRKVEVEAKVERGGEF